MRRSLSRGVYFRSIADSFCKFKAHESGQMHVVGNLEFSRGVATTKGTCLFGYGGESIIGSTQVQIVNALRLGDRNKASVLLSGLGHSDIGQGASDFLHILEYCMRKPDPLFVLETWRHMEEKEITVNERCYYYMVRALCKGGYLEEAFNLLSFLGDKHCIYPILPLFNSLLKSCIQMQSVMHINHCLDLMEQRLVGKSEVTYWELLKLAVWQQNIMAVHELWKEYVKYYSPSILSLRQFIWSFTSLRDLQAAYETLQHMVCLAFSGSNFIIRNAEGKVSSSRFDIPMPTNGEMSLTRSSSEEIEHSLLPVSENCKKMDTSISFDMKSCPILEMKNEIAVGDLKLFDRNKSIPFLKVLRWSFNDVIHASAQSQNSRMAEQLILQMQNLGLEPSSHTYDGFIRAIVSKRSFREGIEALKVMQQQNLKPYDSTLATLAIVCSEVLELDLAEALLEQISETKHVHPYNAYLLACDIVDQPERAVRILSKIKKLKLRPDIRTYELLFSLFGNVNAPYEDGNMLSQTDAAKRINAIEMDMAKNGVQHNPVSIKNLLKAFGAEGMIREMIQYLHMAESQLCLTNMDLVTAIYNTVLHALVEAKESNLATELFKKMKSWGIFSDAATYNIMIDCCSVIKCYKSACALVCMMLRDGFYPQTVTYTTLAKILLSLEDFDEVLSLLDQACSEGVKPNVLLFNTILQEACVKGRIDVVELIIGLMHQSNIEPDPSTCSLVFCAYVDSGFINTAGEALQVLSMQMISEEGCTLEEKRFEYEDLIFAEDLDAEHRILLLFKDSRENVAAALLNLRWLAIAGFSISWAPNQSLWTTRLGGYSKRSTG